MSPLLLLGVAICLSVTGEFLLKHGMNQVGAIHLELATVVPVILKVFTSIFVLGGFAFIFAGSLFWLLVLSRVELSYAYPMLSLGYVVTVIASWILLNETVSYTRLLGVGVICLGVFLVSRS